MVAKECEDLKDRYREPSKCFPERGFKNMGGASNNEVYSSS